MPSLLSTLMQSVSYQVLAGFCCCDIQLFACLNRSGKAQHVDRLPLVSSYQSCRTTLDLVARYCYFFFYICEINFQGCSQNRDDLGVHFGPRGGDEVAWQGVLPATPARRWWEGRSRAQQRPPAPPAQHDQHTTQQPGHLARAQGEGVPLRKTHLHLTCSASLQWVGLGESCTSIKVTRK